MKRKKKKIHRIPDAILSCKSKNRYETYWQAKFVADEQMQHHKNIRLDIYECKLCGGWHLTSKD